MAKLKNKVLGDVSGLLGDFIFRDYKGINVASMRPKNINISNDESSVNRRARFAMAAKLSKAIRQSRDTAISWITEAPANLTVHSYMVKINYPFVSATNISDMIKLVPESNFISSISSFDLREYEIAYRFMPLGVNNGINTTFEKYIKMFSVLFLHSPADPLFPPYTFISLESEAKPFNLNEEIDFSLPLSEMSRQLIVSHYQLKKSYSILITVNEAFKPAKYSDKVISTL